MDIDEENGFAGGRTSQPPSPPSVPQSPSRPLSQSSTPRPPQSSPTNRSSTMSMKKSPKEWFFYWVLFGEAYNLLFTNKPKPEHHLVHLIFSTLSSGVIGSGFIFTTFTGKLFVSISVPIVAIPANAGSYLGLVPHSMGRVLFATVEQNPGFGLLGEEGKDFQIKEADTLEFKANE